MFPPCDCSDSPYKDVHHGHVITGDLSLIRNERLKNLIGKGCNYREDVNINWKKAEKEVYSALSNVIEKMSSKDNVAVTMFDEFKANVKEKVKNEICLLKRRNTKTNFVPVLKDKGAVAELERLHNAYVFTNVDKASKNVGIICKRFYLKSIYDELYHVDPDNQVYELCDEDPEELVRQHHEFSKSIGMTETDLEDFNDLPYVYFTPKFHKNPVKFRSIVASRSCSTKPLANAISKALAKIRMERKYWCDTLERYDGINRYWIIDSSKPILDCIDELNATRTARTVTTYDFSNLYTSLPHDEIFNSLSEIIREVFKARRKKNKPCNLAVYRSHKPDEIWSSTNWVKKPRAGTFYFIEENLISSIRYQLDNTLFTFGGQVFKQKIGIPMGIDDGPEFANGHLHQLEYKYCNNLKKTNIYRARKLGKSFRFIDDITSFNNDDRILELAEEIYGDKVKLNKENQGILKANVLDLTIKIDASEGTATTDLFDKRRAFSFNIVNFPDLSGCIPTQSAYGIIPSQILRYYHSCTSIDDLKSNCHLLFLKCLTQSYAVSNVKNKIRSFCNSHLPPVTKYGCSRKDLLQTLISIIPRDIAVAGRP